MRDIKRVVLTHGHADHRALAPRIQKETGAEVFCHRLEIAKVTNAPAKQKASSRGAAERLFRSLGVPDELLGGLVDGPQDPAFKPRLERATPLDEGDSINFGDIELRVLHTPGHSCGSICLHDDKTGLLFTGDTLLPTSRITALIEADMLSKDPDYNSLLLHIESLQRLLGLGVRGALPGHGQVFDDCEGIVHTLVERHRKRRRHILRALRHGRRTMYEICRSVFLFSSPDDLYLALSEVLGNIGILINDGRVVARRENDLAYYEKA